MGNWTLAFGYINTKKKIFEMPWQKYLVLQIAQLIIDGEHSALVSVGTGHGKSVIIQLLSDILALQGKKIVVVCLNSFLAFWGSNTYGSPWVSSGTIRYVSLEHFLKMEPVKDGVAIFDEID